MMNEIYYIPERNLNGENNNYSREHTSSSLVDILFDDAIFQKLRQGEIILEGKIRLSLVFDEFGLKNYLKDDLEISSIIVESLDSDIEFIFPVKNFKDISLEEIKRRMNMAVNLEKMGIKVGYRDFCNLGDLEWTEELEKFLLEHKTNKNSVSVYGLVLRFHKRRNMN